MTRWLVFLLDIALKMYSKMEIQEPYSKQVKDCMARKGFQYKVIFKLLHCTVFWNSEFLEDNGSLFSHQSAVEVLVSIEM